MIRPEVWDALKSRYSNVRPEVWDALRSKYGGGDVESQAVDPSVVPEQGQTAQETRLAPEIGVDTNTDFLTRLSAPKPEVATSEQMPLKPITETPETSPMAEGEGEVRPRTFLDRMSEAAVKTVKGVSSAIHETAKFVGASSDVDYQDRMRLYEEQGLGQDEIHRRELLNEWSRMAKTAQLLVPEGKGVAAWFGSASAIGALESMRQISERAVVGDVSEKDVEKAGKEGVKTAALDIGMRAVGAGLGAIFSPIVTLGDRAVRSQRARASLGRIADELKGAKVAYADRLQELGEEAVELKKAKRSKIYDIEKQQMEINDKITQTKNRIETARKKNIESVRQVVGDEKTGLDVAIKNMQADFDDAFLTFGKQMNEGTGKIMGELNAGYEQLFKENPDRIFHVKDLLTATSKKLSTEMGKERTAINSLRELVNSVGIPDAEATKLLGETVTQPVLTMKELHLLKRRFRDKAYELGSAGLEYKPTADQLKSTANLMEKMIEDTASGEYAILNQKWRDMRDLQDLTKRHFGEVQPKTGRERLWNIRNEIDTMAKKGDYSAADEIYQKHKANIMAIGETERQLREVGLNDSADLLRGSLDEMYQAASTKQVLAEERDALTRILGKDDELVKRFDVGHNLEMMGLESRKGRYEQAINQLQASKKKVGLEYAEGMEDLAASRTVYKGELLEAEKRSASMRKKHEDILKIQSPKDKDELLALGSTLAAIRASSRYDPTIGMFANGIMAIKRWRTTGSTTARKISRSSIAKMQRRINREAPGKYRRMLIIALNEATDEDVVASE